ncbi:hypothetical protein CNR22_04660 [Sphingobacteriaceae bacterium]|nr:hypothetical protein CNR22_04660 [Sphingobacteriaceae bacterium]
MKKALLIFGIVFSMFSTEVSAQSSYNTAPREKFGPQINIGAGLGYYGPGGYLAPAIVGSVEFDIARNITLAPFVGFYTYSNYYYWGGPNHPYGNYRYRETVVPIGVKGAYYFDQLFQASEKWDFYAAASAGFAIRSRSWDSGYYGDRDVVAGPSPLYVTAHIGSRVHLTQVFGLYLDLSTGMSTFGLSFKL